MSCYEQYDLSSQDVHLSIVKLNLDAIFAKLTEYIIQITIKNHSFLIVFLHIFKSGTHRKKNSIKP